MNHYILDKKKNIKECDLLEWARWFENPNNRIVKQTTIKKSKISTVFLGLDHSFSNKGKPILWETMIFGGKDDGYQERYTSEKDALKGHQKAINIIKGEDK